MKKNCAHCRQKQKAEKNHALLLELLIILLLAIALFITTNYQKLKRISWT